MKSRYGSQLLLLRNCRLLCCSYQSMFYKKFSLLKHLALIMLHDYLHCLVFKEQSCSALLSKCLSLQATHLSYRIGFDLSRTFLKFSFLSKLESNHLQSLANQGLLNCVFCSRSWRLVLYYTSQSCLSTLFPKKINFLL